MVKALPYESSILVMKNQVAVWEQLYASDTLVGSVCLPGNSPICLGEGQVPVPAEREGGLLVHRVVAVCIPDPPHEALIVGNADSDGEYVRIRGGVVEA